MNAWVDFLAGHWEKNGTIYSYLIFLIPVSSFSRGKTVQILTITQNLPFVLQDILTVEKEFFFDYAGCKVKTYLLKN